MCTSPLVRFRFKYEPKSNVPFYHSEVRKNKKQGIYTFLKSKCNNRSGFVIKSKKELQSYFDSHGQYLAFMDSYCDYLEIPCGKCAECRKNYARDWAVRCYHESLCHVQNCFITLTFDNLANDKFVSEIERSYKNGSNKYCKGCVNGSRYYRYPIDYSLCKGLVYMWLKKFRDYLFRHYRISIRYFGCGEYGSDVYTSRPHLHILIFGYNFPDVYVNGKLKYRTFNAEFSKKGVQMRISEELRMLWPYGNCYVEDLNIASAKYVAQYCMKKVKGYDKENMYDYYFGRIPEFIFMSKGNCQVNRCPHIDEIISNRYNSLRNLYIPFCNNCKFTRGGLGFNWLMKNLYDLRRTKFVVIEGQKYPIPKYYKNVIKLTDEKLYDTIHSDNIYYVNEQLNLHPDKNSIEECKKRKEINLAKLRNARNTI